MTKNYQFLVTSPGQPGTFCFQILPNGNLLEVSSTVSGAGFLKITPNNQLVITYNGYDFSLSSTGILAYDTSIPTTGNLNIDPLGRGVLAVSSLTTFSVYTINYNTGTLNITSTYLMGLGNYQHFSFTPDGKLGFLSGLSPVSPNGGSLWVLNIDSAFNVTTTSQIFNVENGIYEPAISSDGRYLWAPTGGYIELFTISTTGQVMDTGQQYYVANDTDSNQAYFLRNTPDERFAIVEYNENNLATEIINGDGSLSWTGFTLPYEYGAIVDFVIVPVYTTSVPEELWKDSPPDIEIKSSAPIQTTPFE